jgi:DNA-directed RNA polymerase subunit M/transcription elongation factor TFIIS
MAIKEKEVWVPYSPRTVKHYKDKGYIFPTYKDLSGKDRIKRGTKILVKLEDLSKNSGINVTKICDVCGIEVLNQPQRAIMKARKNSTDGLDRCQECGYKKTAETLATANEFNCVATTHPEFAKLFWNEEDTKIYKYGSTKRVDFKCPKCNSRIRNKCINTVHGNGVGCPCRDGISYPQKFMNSVLSQLKVNFETEKTFDWCKNIKANNSVLNGRKFYDFYLSELNIIIETHGQQHSIKGFNNEGARTLEEEQENDELKERLAIENGIKEENYIIIDCRYSEMEFIKSNILKSELNNLFDLSQIDWLKCHEFSCNSLVKEVCDLWNKGYGIGDIYEIKNIHRSTVRRYLVKGMEMNLCKYNVEEGRKRGFKWKDKKKTQLKPIIQLSLNGEFIREWKSAKEAERVLKINRSSISSVCKGKQITAGEYKWMFKKEYSPQKALEIGKIKRDIYKKSVVQLSLNGEFIREWESVTEASKSLFIKTRSHISCVCNGKRKTSGGFKWMYAEEYYQQREALIPLDSVKQVQSNKLKIEQLELAF